MILAKRYEKWGIDVDVQFTDNQNNQHTITMRFDSEEQIEAELESRVARQIASLDEEVNNGI